jgi:putative phosphoribosyl transferase
MITLFSRPSESHRFLDRHEAGRALGEPVRDAVRGDDVVVLGLPRGGVPVAYEVAQALQAPLDVFVVRKLGVPGHEELAMGAIASGGVRVLSEDVIDDLRVRREQVEEATIREGRELARREALFRGDQPPLSVEGRTVVVVDDGLATGATMRAAVESLRLLGPDRIVVAVPVASREACDAMEEVADDCICVLTPDPLYAVGAWYVNFEQTPDEEVQALLRDARATR